MPIGGRFSQERNCAFVVDHAAGRSRVTDHLSLLRFDGPGDQAMHIDVEGRFEEAVLARVLVPNRAAARIFINQGAKFRVLHVVDLQFHRIRRGRTDEIEIHLVRFQLVFQEIVPFENLVLIGMHEARARLHV